MDVLEKKRILIDAIEVKIEQLTDLKSELIDEYNQEVIARQQAAAQQRAAQAASEKPVAPEAPENVSKEKAAKAK